MNQNFAALNAELIDLQGRIEQLQTTASEASEMTSRSYRRIYSVSTARPQVLLDRDGRDLPRGFVATFACAVDGTNESGTSSWLVKRADSGAVYVERFGAFSATSTNTPEIFDNNGVPSVRLFNHPSNYNVMCRAEQLLP